MQKEYYVIGSVNDNRYPLLVVKKNGRYENEDDYIDDPQPMEYRLGKPVPAKPVMVDYHSSPNSILSTKIASVLTDMKIKGIQLILATITGKDNELYEDYRFLHIHNNLPALDREKSKYNWMKTIQVASPIEKLVLNEAYLSSLPLEDRLVFRLAENSVFEIFHQSVVDAIMATNPVGVQFIPVEKWNMGVAFE